MENIIQDGKFEEGFINHKGEMCDLLTPSEFGADSIHEPHNHIDNLVTSGVYEYDKRYFRSQIYCEKVIKVHEYTKDEEGIYNFLKTLPNEELGCGYTVE